MKNNDPKELSQNAKVIIYVVLASILILFISMCDSCGKDDSKLWYEKDLSYESWDVAEKHVLSNLKIPSTADFPFGAATKCVTKVDDYRYRIRCHVDSQNDFGATIRTKFTCMIVWISEGKYEIKDFITE